MNAQCDSKLSAKEADLIKKCQTEKNLMQKIEITKIQKLIIELTQKFEQQKEDDFNDLKLK